MEANAACQTSSHHVKCIICRLIAARESFCATEQIVAFIRVVTPVPGRSWVVIQGSHLSPEFHVSRGSCRSLRSLQYVISPDKRILCYFFVGVEGMKFCFKREVFV